MSERERKRCLVVENLYRDYPKEGSKQVIEVLKDISFEVKEQEFIGVMGKSGCGKTTLLKVLGLIDRPTKGKILFWEKDTNELWSDELSDIRRREIGFVFQDFYLMDSLSVRENIMLPMVLDKAKGERCMKRSKNYARHFGLGALLDKYPYELSGGEKQRVAICRALINNPDLILADEPTGNLDSKSGKIVISALEMVNRKLGKTIIMVTHDPQMASHCGKIILLKDGRILDTLVNSGDNKQFYQKIIGRMEEL